MPRVLKVDLGERDATVRLYWGLRDNEKVYEARWFADFQDRWQKALRDERWNFRARLEGA